MDERLKDLMQDLGNAINESISESDRIAEAIGEIKRAGYDVFLVLEATIGFNKRDTERDTEEDDDENDLNDKEPIKPEPKKITAGSNLESSGKIKFTKQDLRFLKALKIAGDDAKG